MKKKTLNKLDLDLYEEELDNGLRIFIVPMKNQNNYYVTFTTKFGSNDISFIPPGQKDYITVPAGIAHFLEHKVFEQKDGVDPFTFYSERGSDANANTNNFKTTYLFSGTSFFEDNMNFLLDYVQSPYFTDENVEKEKGIIEQEMKMYMDNPYSVIVENMTSNLYKNHPMKIPVIGNNKSIYSTTKEDLYNCYNTFYHPSNMFVTVTGNVDPEKVISIIKENQAKKDFAEKPNIKLKEYEEDASVAKSNDEIIMNVNIPKVGIAYKFIIDKIDVELIKIRMYIGMFLDIMFDSTSLLNEELINDNIITEDLYVTAYSFDKFYTAYILAESHKKDELFKKIKNSIKNYKINEEDFNRKKKVYIAGLIGSSDSIYAINSKIVNNIIRYDKIIYNDYDKIKSLNFDEFNEVISKLDFSNYLTYAINPKETK